MSRCIHCGGELEIIGNSYVCQSCGNKTLLDSEGLINQKDETDFYNNYIMTCKQKVITLDEPKYYIKEVAMNSDAYSYKSKALYKMEEMLQKYYESIDKAIMTTPGDENVKTKCREILNNEATYFKMEYEHFLDNDVSNKVEYLLQKLSEKQELLNRIEPKNKKENPEKKLSQSTDITLAILGIGSVVCCFNPGGNSVPTVFFITMLLTIISLIPLTKAYKDKSEYKQYEKDEEQASKVTAEIDKIYADINELFTKY